MALQGTAQLRSGAALPARASRRVAAARGAALRPVAAGAKEGGKKGTQRIYVGKGKYVDDDPSKYPGREENAAAGGWAGGEKGLWAFRAELTAKPPPAPKAEKPKTPSARTSATFDIDLSKDFNSMAGGFPGGEVGLKAFTETGKVAKRSAPPSIGLGAYVAVTAAAAYAACVYVTGDLNPQDWEFTTGGAGGAAPTEEAAAASGKRQVVLPALPAVDVGVAQAVAPPAAVAGGVVLAGVALQAGVRKLTDSVGRTARIALFGAAVLFAAGKILNVL